MTANRIIQHIFQTPDIKQVDEAALEQLVSAHPYFIAARLLLAKKQYSIQQNLLSPAVKKAQQYSSNMHYFYRFITTEEKAPVAPAPVVPAPVAPVAAAPVVPPAPVIVPEPVAPIAAAPVVPPAPVVVPEPVAPVAAAPVVPPAPVVVPEPVAPVAAAPVVPPAPVVVPEPTPVTPPAETITITNQTAVLDEKTTAEEPIKIFPLDIPQGGETTLTFQPLYSDDYFAYKRLKEPNQAEALNEKGAAEMKSFTSWLKDLKHSFVEKASKEWYHQQMHRSYEDVDPEVSETVEKMAMESITLNNDVVSETLAEIWARQHQYKTAIHIYQKLSLLNPNKSAYFAQKIKELQLLTEKN